MFPAILSMTLRLTLAGAVAACAASPVFAQAADSGGGSVARSSARFSDAVELMRTDSSGNSVRVKVQNDDVVLVEVNGEAVPLDRARLSARAIEVLDADGKVLQRFDRPRTGGSAQGSAQGGARRVERGGQTSVTRDIEIMRSGPAEVRIASAEAPKSMIGIGLGEIDPALAHHLELDPATATLITNVIEELPAHLAGIERFDVIVAIDGSESAPRAEVAAKLGRAEVEVTTAAFDPTRIQGDLSERRAAEEQAMLDLFFVGPDGVRRGLRMPPMDGAMRVPGVAFEGLDPEQLRLIEGAWSQFLEDFESMPQLDAADPIEERLRRMEERMEEMRRKLEQGVEKRAEPGSKGR
jgi:hypothetical protein